MAGLQLNKIGFDQNKNTLLFVCSEAVESKLVKLETSRTVILPPKVNVLWREGVRERERYCLNANEK